MDITVAHSAGNAAQTDRRKQRLLDIMSKGLPTLPSYVLDLNALLGSPTVDLKKVAKFCAPIPA